MPDAAGRGHTGPKPPNGLTQLYAEGVHVGVAKLLAAGEPNVFHGKHWPHVWPQVWPHGWAQLALQFGKQFVENGNPFGDQFQGALAKGGHGLDANAFGVAFHPKLPEGKQLVGKQFDARPFDAKQWDMGDVQLFGQLFDIGGMGPNGEPQVTETGMQPKGVHAKVQLLAVMQQPFPVKSGHALPRQPKGMEFDWFHATFGAEPKADVGFQQGFAALGEHPKALPGNAPAFQLHGQLFCQPLCQPKGLEPKQLGFHPKPPKLVPFPKDGA